MIELDNLIPKDKHDIKALEKLSNYTFEEIHPIIPDLLKWLQDLNWPVSKPVAEFLIPHSEKIVPELIEVLRTKDEVWKYWILTVFGNVVQSNLFKDEVRRIAQNPTDEEIEEEVYELALDLIQH